MRKKENIRAKKFLYTFTEQLSVLNPAGIFFIGGYMGRLRREGVPWKGEQTH